MSARSLLPLLLALLLPACAVPAARQAAARPAAAVAPGRARGRLDGTMIREGGPLGPGGQQPTGQPVAGTITITRAGHPSQRVRAGASGRFSVLLAPGRYRLCGAAPRVTGGGAAARSTLPRHVSILAHRTTTVTVIFAVP